MNKIINLIFIICFPLIACGRMTEPKAPEVVSPTPVVELIVTPAVDGLTFDWKSPETSQEGKTLRQIDGYRIYRKEIKQSADLFDQKIPFDELAFVEDTHLKVLDEERKKAREQGMITRKISVPAESKKFTWKDNSATGLELNKTYAYLLVPVNQGSTEGAVEQIIRVTFTGLASEIRPVSYVKNAYTF